MGTKFTNPISMFQFPGEPDHFTVDLDLIQLDPKILSPILENT